MKSLEGDTKLGDIESGKSIRLLVDSFYDQVLQDDLLGPIFDRVISDWETHLPTMYQFWERLLFGSGDYQGNPFQKHVNLPVEKDHFTSWVNLFTRTIDENFSGPRAEHAKKLARNIAGTFQLRLGMNPEEGEHAIPNYSRQ